jgi:hypothetical protein
MPPYQVKTRGTFCTAQDARREAWAGVDIARLWANQAARTTRMVTISMTAEAFAAIEATLPKGAKGEPRLDGKGGLLIVNSLKAPRGPGEGCSDVILRVATAERRS